MTESKTMSLAALKKILRKHVQKIIALIFWMVFIGLYQWYAITNGLSPVEVVQKMLSFFKQGYWGVLVFILFYNIRLLILFPATLIMLAAGFVFGPVLGVLYTIIASNLSSTLIFFVGRLFGADMLKDDGSNSLIQRYARRMRKNSFETVMVMRFILLPHDAVSYLAGFLRIKYWTFILATATGSIPSTMAVVGFGASIEIFDDTLPKLNPITLGFSVALLVLSLALSRMFKKNEETTT